MINNASGMRARSLVRRYLVATVVLGVFAGLAGGAALGIWGTARRTETVYDRFVAYEDAATLQVYACPEGVDEAMLDSTNGAACAGFDYEDIRGFLDSLPGVESSGRFTQALASVAPSDRPEAWARQQLPVAIDASAVPAMGTPIVVAGRLADPSAPFEVVINEEAATRLGYTVGDRLDITPYRTAEFDIAGVGDVPPSGPPTEVTIVGVGRRPADLVGRLGRGAVDEDDSIFFATPAWWQEMDGDVAQYGIAVAVNLRSGTTDEDVRQALHDRWPGRLIDAVSAPLWTAGNEQPVRDAIRLQVLGLRIVAATFLLAGLVFVGQALARQVRREWDDTAVLDALGMGRAEMVSAAGVRALAFAIVALPVAAATAIAISPFGPAGIGRAAEPNPGIAVDGLVLTIGLPTLALAVMVFAVVPVAAFRRHAAALPSTRRGSRLLAALPPTGIAGWAMTSSRRAGRFALGSAVIGVALACAGGIAAWSLTSSYHDLIASPATYGATWDATVGNVGSDQQQTDTRAALRSIPGIRAVGIKSATGIGSMPDATAVAAETFLGEVDFGEIISGRGPVADDEVALGRLTLRKLGASVGDTVELQSPSDLGARSLAFEVVGEVAVNDGNLAQPGQGALLTDDGFDLVAPNNLSGSYAVWVDPGVDRDATLGELRRAFPTTFVEHRVPMQIQDLGLVSGQPALLALMVGVLAGAALVHALVMSVRRGRRQIGVLKTLGFRRRQVAISVGWHASSIAVTALIIGIPLGVIGGRLAWIAIADGLGIASSPVVPVSAMLVITALVLVVANLAALGPGLVAARTSAATALRTE